MSKELSVYEWKVTTGMYSIKARKPREEVIATPLLEALEYMAEGNKGGPHAESLFILHNIKEFVNQPAIRQQLRDTAYILRTVGSAMIAIGGHFDIPEELEDVVAFVDFDLPTKEELKTTFRSILDEYAESINIKTDELEPVLELAAENATGLTEFRAESALALSIAVRSGVDIELLRYEKQMSIKQSGVLEYMAHSESMDTLGGFDTLKSHVLTRKGYFDNQQKAFDYGLRPPKGIMCVGIAGTGKSLAAKAIARSLDLPLYRFDVGALFKGVVGASEAATKNALKLIETVAPCVLLVDEMEKLMSGLESSGKSDSGVTSRVIGNLISWMQETTAPVYKVATCNSIRNLDAALFRRGRWDAVFGVDLPNPKERETIFNIHLSKRKRDPRNFDLELLSAASHGFVGAEIESAVEEALYVAFSRDREVTTEDIAKVIQGIVPISKTDREDIEEFRKWLSTRATPVSSTYVAAAAPIAPKVPGTRTIRTTTN